jgi:hypothetical protein
VVAAVKRIAIAARLRPGAHERAKEMISRGPPFDLGRELVDGEPRIAEQVYFWERPSE